MDTIEAILTRRSYRKYNSNPVTEENINIILRAGMHAPSAGNQQPWHFVVIKERKILDKVPSVHPYAEMLKTAQAAVLVCCDLELEKHKGMFVQDCAAATQNMLLAAHALGLGTCWLGVYPRQDRMDGLT
jgi:nitroreductase